MICRHCNEEVEDLNRSKTIPHFGEKGHEDRVYHVECVVRMIIGSVGHQNQRCSCYGGTEEDPPGISTREAAIASYKLFHKQTRKEMEGK